MRVGARGQPIGFAAARRKADSARRVAIPSPESGTDATVASPIRPRSRIPARSPHARRPKPLSPSKRRKKASVRLICFSRTGRA